MPGQAHVVMPDREEDATALLLRRADHSVCQLLIASLSGLFDLARQNGRRSLQEFHARPELR